MANIHPVSASFCQLSVLWNKIVVTFLAISEQYRLPSKPLGRPHITCICERTSKISLMYKFVYGLLVKGIDCRSRIVDLDGTKVRLQIW